MGGPVPEAVARSVVGFPAVVGGSGECFLVSGQQYNYALKRTAGKPFRLIRALSAGCRLTLR